MKNSKGPRPEPLPPFDENESVLPVKSVPRGTASPAEFAFEKLATKVDAIMEKAIECGNRAVAAHEAVSGEMNWSRRLKLVALASDNGKASVDESKERLERMIGLLDDLDAIEERLLPPEDDDEGDVIVNRMGRS